MRGNGESLFDGESNERQFGAWFFAIPVVKLVMKRVIFIFLLIGMSIVAFANDELSRQVHDLLNTKYPVTAIAEKSIDDILEFDWFARISALRLADYGDAAPAIYLREVDALLMGRLGRIEITRRTRSREAFNQYLEAARQDAMVHMIDNSDLANAHRTIYGWIEEFRRRL